MCDCNSGCSVLPEDTYNRWSGNRTTNPRGCPLYHGCASGGTVIVCVWVAACVCSMCGQVCVTITVHATFLTTRTVNLFCSLIVLVQYRTKLNYLRVFVCVCWELAHVALPLQSRSALWCCFHSSRKSQHSQPRSLPSFTLLVPACSDTLPTFFLVTSFRCPGVWTGVDALQYPCYIHSLRQDQPTRVQQLQRNSKLGQRFSK